MAALINVPAGRCTRRPGTKWVDPQAERGAIELRIEDDLLHLCWKSRQTGVVEDDLIIFPGEATFEKVSQDSTGRTHILKFSSSDQKYFFWFQRKATEGDARAQVDINELLQDPSYTVGSAPIPEAPAAASSSGNEGSSSTAELDEDWPPTPGAPRLSHPSPLPASSSNRANVGAASSAGTSSSNPQTEMARLLMQWAQTGGLPAGGAGEHEEASLNDVLSPANITSLINSNPEIGERIAPHLPSALGVSAASTASELLPILTAPQFADAVSSLDEALRSGGLPGSVMRELGLPEDAGLSVTAFLNALRGLKKSGTGGAAADGDVAMEE